MTGSLPWYKRNPQRGCVYFIGAGPRPLRVKIGYTRGDVTARLRQLQTGSPVELRIVATIDGGPDLEARLHRTFRPLHVRGEWFTVAHKLESLLFYLEDGTDFDAALHDCILSACPPHPSIDRASWNASAVPWGGR